MDIEFKCNDSNFKDVETFFFSQEYDKKPPFDKIILYLTDTHKIYMYPVENEFGRWYIVT